MHKGEHSRRLGKEYQAKEATGWAEVGQADRPRPAGPTHFEAPSPPFDLAVIRAIYSPEARRHTSILSPSATDEQRRE
jgi:hypothetical protein